MLLASSFVGMIALLGSCIDRQKYAPKPYYRPLEIVKLTENDFLHISYLKNKNGGYIPSNGYMRKEDDEVLIFDTPSTDSLSEELIKYVEIELGATIKGVVISHFYKDAVGGLKAFNTKNIPSYATAATARKLAQDSLFITNSIDSVGTLKMGTIKVESKYLGKAYTDGDLFSYIAKDSILYAGRTIRDLNASKGDKADVYPDDWATTLDIVKGQYPDVQLIITANGMRGGKELLESTVIPTKIE